MFALVVAGRLPQSSGTQVDATHLVFQLDRPEEINHLTVFMTGAAPFPPGYAATVHILLPGAGQSWRMLGCLKNEKPSAIFRLKGGVGAQGAPAAQGGSNLFSQQGMAANPAAFEATTRAESLTASLGISVEPEESVERQMEALRASSGSGDASSSGGAQSGALVKAGQAPPQGGTIDPQMALALAPKIGGYSQCAVRLAKPQSGWDRAALHGTRCD